MFTIYKFLRNFFKALVSENHPWQVGLGVLFGCLLGFLPLFSLSHEFIFAWPAAVILVAALALNVHLGSVLLFLGLSSLLYLISYPVAEAIGNSLSGFAQTAAGIPLLHAAGLSHTGWLGMTIIGIIFAIVASIIMWRFTVYFRTVLLPKLKERQRLVKVGKVANRGLLVRGLCWFLGV